jgi:benzoyl-CoA reductase subunit C
VEKALENFSRITGDPYSYLTDWKKANKRKIIGLFPMHLPEEIIHAAGMLPVMLWRSNNPITLGDAHISARNCAITRSVIDDVVTGRLSFLDGLVMYRTCMQAYAIPYVVERNAPLPYMESIYLPVFITSTLAKDYLLLNLEKLRVSLEKFSGQSITDQSLQNSIQIYNKDRALLRRLYELRRQRPGLLKAKEVLAIVQSSMLMPKEEHIKLLEELLPQLERRESSTGKNKANFSWVSLSSSSN